MLQSLRAFTQGIFFKALFILLLISFALWGIGDIFQSNPQQQPILEIGEEKISAERFENDLRLELMRLNFQTGQNVSLSRAIELGLKQRVQETMKQQALFNQEAERLGLQVSADLVAEKIHAEKQFHNEKGQFDTALFQRMLNEMRRNETQYIGLMQQEYAREQLVVGLATSVVAPPALTEALYKSRNEKRSITRIKIEPEQFPAPKDPGDTALLRYYQDKSKELEIPEQRDVTLLILSAADIGKDTPIADAELSAAFEAQKESLIIPEQRSFQQFLTDDEDVAKKIAAAIKAGDQLSKIALAHKNNPLPLENFIESDLPPDLQKPAFALKAGEATNAIKTALGWHVLLLEKITPSRQPDFAEAKEKIKEILQKERSVDLFNEKLNAIDDALASDQPISAIAAEHNITPLNLKALPLKPEAEILQQLPEPLRDTDWIERAFAIEEGSQTPLFEMSNGDQMSVRVNAITAPRLPAFDEIRETVLQDWQKEQQVKAAKDRAEAMVSNLKSGQKLATLLQQPPKLTAEAAITIPRQGGIDMGISDLERAIIFSLKLGEATPSFSEGNSAVYVLDKIIKPSIEEAEIAMRDFSQGVANDIRDSMITEWSQNLQKRFSVKTDVAAMERLGQSTAE